MLFFILYTYFSHSIKYVPSTDQTRLEINGSYEEVTQEGYQNSGTFTTYKYVDVKEGIIKLCNNVFEGSINLLQVNLPSTLRSIGSSCFRGCSNLQFLIIPKGVEKINSDTFRGCSSLLNLTLPSTLNCIEGAHTFFSACLEKFIIEKQNIFTTDAKGSLVIENETIAVVAAGRNKEIVIPSSIKIIRSYFFNAYPYVTSIKFEPGSKLEEIQNSAFRGTKIICMEIPNGTLTLRSSIFTQSAIENVSIPSTVVSVSADVFAGSNLKNIDIKEGCKDFFITDSGVILNGNQSTLLFIPEGTTNYNISSSTTSVNYEMIRTQSLSSLKVDKLNTDYSDYENMLYSKDKSILYSNSGGNKYAKIHKDCRTVYESAFYDTLVTTIEFLGNVTTIGNFALQRTYSLESIINFPNTVTKFGSWCFTYSAITTFDVPSSLYQFGEYPFSEANSLVSLDFSNCAKLTSFSLNAFSGCSGLRSLTLPQSLTEISSGLFQNCVSLCNISIPSRVKSLLESAFYNSGITKIIFEGESELQVIDDQCFLKSKLEEIDIPNSVWHIGFKALSECEKLRSVKFSKDSKLGSVREDFISGSPNVKRIFFGSNLSTLSPGAISQCEGLDTIEIDSGNKWFKSVENVIYNITQTELIGCPAGLQSVGVPESVVKISERAFYKCSKLKTITFLGNSELVSIGKSTFEGCNGLRIISFPSQLSEIGIGAFAGCSSLHTVIFPSKLGTVGSSAFKGCSALSNVTFPENAQLTEISRDAFSSCLSLSSIELPNGLKSIGIRGFFGCSKLQYVGLPFDIEKIEQLAFGECQLLQSVAICRSTDIPEGSSVAFTNCNKNLRIIVSNNFTSNTFCGAPILPILDEDCLTPSFRFTVGTLNSGFDTIILMQPLTVVNDVSTAAYEGG